MTSADVKKFAREVGFDLCGIAPVDSFPELLFLEDWLDRGYAGEMRYMERTKRRRSDVRQVLPSARSVIALATLYNTDRPYSTEQNDPNEATISRYAWGEDYHDILKQRTEALLERLRGASKESFDARCYVDTGPIQERVYAQYAGLGWIGKNTCLIHPEQGSWFFLSEIITSLSLEVDTPQLDQCGTCTLCLEACPTDALREPGVLDSTRCLSYLTIELRGPIPDLHRPDLENHVYGCDICQDVCPYNADPSTSNDPAWQPRPAFDRPSLVSLWNRDDADLAQELSNSAMSRAGVVGLRRNVATALGNTSNAKSAEELNKLRNPREASYDDPTVAEHVAWAQERLGNQSNT